MCDCTAVACYRHSALNTGRCYTRSPQEDPQLPLTFGDQLYPKNNKGIDNRTHRSQEMEIDLITFYYASVPGDISA